MIWEHADSVAVDGLRYLAFLGGTAHPSTGALEGYLDQPRPVRKSLSDAVHASKGPAGKDLLDWMVRIGWVDVVDDAVSITDLGTGILAAVDGRQGGPEHATTTPAAAAGDDPESARTPGATDAPPEPVVELVGNDQPDDEEDDRISA